MLPLLGISVTTDTLIVVALVVGIILMGLILFQRLK